MAWPVDPKWGISCKYGKKGPMWKSGWHQGVDFPVTPGTPVRAPMPGTVIGVGNVWGAAFGHHQVVVQVGKNLYVIFAHMKEFDVKAGQVVKTGDLLGRSAAEGNVAGPHLHMEVQDHRLWQSGHAINPNFVLDYKPKGK